MTSFLYRRTNERTPYALLRETDSFGFSELDLVAPPSRFWANTPPGPTAIDSAVDALRVEALPTPGELAAGLPDTDNWHAQSRRSLDRLEAWFLICEDPQRRLDAHPVATLGHQASLVRHVLQSPNLDRVLIADEVGLGKTIEAGLILGDLLEREPQLRVLYLAPARLVRNVHQEFERLGLHFRKWIAGDDRDATLRDPRIVASIHRAAFRTHFDAFVNTDPWNVIVVDECHHLSDWEMGGGSPRRNYRLVEELVRRQSRSSRLILMSGTPHQGHPHRFENLLALMRRDDEGKEDLAGRVIYRTKDDVRDWEGNPLFPARRVNEPTFIDLGSDHRAWLSSIHDLYVPPVDPSDHRGRRRAAGWRCAQALQWASSSVQAGLGYLVRQAIRVDWTVEDSTLRDAVAAIRPYRLGDPLESVNGLFARIQREVQRQSIDRDVEDIEDDAENTESWEPDPVLLRRLLRDGTDLVRSSGDRKWNTLWDELLHEAPSEKAVLFAQPIETVTSLASYLQRKTGRAPALIIGDQSPEERERQVAAFWRPDGPRFLVSSRAGGEGINLQVARRLIHVDVPWNPMELEQRIGRVHRFGSRQTILVDTLVARESRETHAYQIARKKLVDIASALVPSDRFEGLFSRVMSLVSPTDLQEILGERPLAPLSDEETRRVSELVSRGFANWRSFHDRFSSEERRIQRLDPGSASWQDVIDFVQRHLRAEPMAGFEALAFRWVDGEAAESSTCADVLKLQDGQVFACGDFAGMPVTGRDGARVDTLGLNRKEMCEALRRVALPSELTGAAHLRWPDDQELPHSIRARPFGLWISARMTLRWQSGRVSPIGTRLTGKSIDCDGVAGDLDSNELGKLVRALLRATVRRQAPAGVVLEAVRNQEHTWINELRKPSIEDRRNEIRHAVFPLFAAVVV